MRCPQDCSIRTVTRSPAHDIQLEKTLTGQGSTCTSRAPVPERTPYSVLSGVEGSSSGLRMVVVSSSSCPAVPIPVPEPSNPVAVLIPLPSSIVPGPVGVTPILSIRLICSPRSCAGVSSRRSVTACSVRDNANEAAERRITGCFDWLIVYAFGLPAACIGPKRSVTY